MLSHKRLLSLLVLAVSLSQISCLRIQVTPRPDAAKLLAAAREYGKNRQPSQALQDPQATQQTTASLAPALEEESTYKRQIAASFNGWDFGQLETEAREARTSKARVLGGVWKLYEFYEVVSQPAAGSQATESDWTNHLETLKQWKSAQPQSVTAQVAIAEAYVNYAWQARGSGSSGTVTNNGWALFNDRLGMAASALMDATQLKEKCPYWFEAMQHVALGQGWQKPQARELFEQAAAFEPTYYHYYREYANFLLPKWYGEEGETAAFGKEVSDRVGGQQGDFLYFEIASLAICTCSSEKPPMPHDLSWPRIKRGYVALSQLYGVTDLKANRYALMAYVADDKAAAREAFANVGEDLSEGIWLNRQNFEDAKAWSSNM